MWDPEMQFAELSYVIATLILSLKFFLDVYLPNRIRDRHLRSFGAAGGEPSLMMIPYPSRRLIAVWAQQLRLWYLVTDFSLNQFRWLYPTDEKHPGGVLDGSHPRITACIRQLKIRFTIPGGRSSLNRFRYHHLLWGRFRKIFLNIASE